MHRKFIALALAGAVVWSAPAAVEGISLEVDPQAVMEILPLAVEAVAIQQRADGGGDYVPKAQEGRLVRRPAGDQ